MKEKKIGDLNNIYNECESCDKSVFAEMRSNILLVSGNHYKKVREGLDRAMRHLNVQKNTRVRLTINFTQKATSDIKDIILSQASDFKPFPKNKDETSDVKSAELAESVWQHIKDENQWNDFVQREVNSFVDLGEAACKIFFDPSQGELIGYEQKVDELGNPLFTGPDGEETPEQFNELIVDEMGQPIPFESVKDEKRPKFRGKLCIEKVYAYNLKRSPSAKTMKESPVIVLEKMLSIEKAKAMFANTDDPKLNAELESKLTESSDKTYKIFDANKAGFSESKKEVMVREYYFRQCPEYPKGYYYIATEDVILAEGELPFGEFGDIAFPIKHTGYDIIESCARYSSAIRNIRPFQAEINRAASSQAETQLTLGKDKMVLFGGGTVSKGVDMEGIRTIHATGREPMVIPGRSGEQFTGYLERMIEYLRYAVGLPSDNVNASGSQAKIDPMGELFKDSRQKKKFSRAGVRFEQYGKEICETALFLASKYLPEDMMIRAVGKKEAVNIEEFKGVDRLDYSVRVAPVSGDSDSNWGKYITLQTISQYFGKDMPDHLKPAIIKSFPFLNEDPVINEMMLEFDSPRNMILALDRGEDFLPGQYDNAQMMLKSLMNRTRSSDFSMLAPEIQEKYADTIVEYQGVLEQQAQEQVRIQNGVIPSGGSLAKCDLYVTVPNSEGGTKTERAVVPSEALEWLLDKLASQSMAQERLQELGTVQGGLEVMDGVQFPDQTAPQPMPIPEPPIV